MTELDHDDLRYQGVDGEDVTITVTPQGTTQLAAYTLDGMSHALPAGAIIRFKLTKKGAGQPTVLELNLDFNGQGSYRVVISKVTNEPNNECVQVFDGPPLSINIFRFFTS